MITPTKRKPWRPEGWVNPHLGGAADCDSMSPGEDKYYCQSFEAGADAILEALRTKGESLGGRKSIGFIWKQPMWGTLVLVPDEDQEKP